MNDEEEEEEEDHPEKEKKKLLELEFLSERTMTKKTKTTLKKNQANVALKVGWS